MKRWSIFGAAAGPEAKRDAPRMPPPSGFEWSGMFNIRKKLQDRREQHERAEVEETS